MPDLKEGEQVAVPGSARLPYLIKNVYGVYSCSCPAWRNQSLPIERRSCKHIRNLRGEQAELERIGILAAPAIKNTSPSPPKTVPGFLLAESWDNSADLSGWWQSEKLDGVRAWWNGSQFLSRQGNVYHAPHWFAHGLPEMPLDGELWLTRKAFQRTVSIVRRHDESEHWREIAFLVFDAPDVNGPFEERQRVLESMFSQRQPQYARVLQQERCTGTDHLQSELSRIVALGGEGLMLRRPESLYEAGRSQSLQKVKRFQDAEVHVIGLQAGKGRHRGRMGALLVELPSGIQFAVGTGFTDAQRENPPAIGAAITVRFQELTDRGVPRFPSFVRIRTDVSGRPT